MAERLRLSSGETESRRQSCAYMGARWLSCAERLWLGARKGQRHDLLSHMELARGLLRA
jgi:hypothetical protein